MEKEVYLAIGALGGALVTAGFAIVNSSLTARRERAKRDRDETTKALNEVHAGLSELRQRFSDIFAHSLGSFATGELREIDFKPMTTSADHIDLQLGVFAADLSAEFEKVKQAMRTVTNDWVDCNLMVSQNKRDPVKFKAMIDRSVELSPAIDAFQKRLTTYIREERKKG